MIRSIDACATTGDVFVAFIGLACLLLAIIVILLKIGDLI